MGSGQHIIDDSCLSLSYSDIPGFISSNVSGHAGLFSVYQMNNYHVLSGIGRLHYYEGYEYNDVVTIIDLFNCMGIDNIIITNSSGCLNEGWGLNKLMVVNSYIDTTLKVNKSIEKTKLPMNHIYHKIYFLE